MGVTTIKTGGGATYHQKIVRDAWGVLYFPDSENDVLYIYKSIDGTNWTKVNTGITAPAYPSMCIDSSGEFHVVFHANTVTGQYDSWRIQYTKTISGVWQTPINLTSGLPPTAPGATITIDSSDNLHVVFYRNLGLPTYSYPYIVSYIKYTKSTETWGSYADITPSAPQGYSGYSLPVLAVAPDNSLHMICMGRYDDTTGDQVYYKKYVGGAWGSLTRLSSGGQYNNCHSMTIEVDTNGVVHTAWYEVNATKYKKYTTSWQTTETVDTSSVYLHTYSLAIDKAGSVFLAGIESFDSTHTGIAYLKRTTSWGSLQEVVASSTGGKSAVQSFHSVYPLSNSNNLNVPLVGTIFLWQVSNTRNNYMYSTSDLSLSTPLPHYTVTASAGANGTITNAGDNFVHEGDNISFSINPNNNYAIADVLVDSVSVGAVSSYQFTNVTAPHTISCTFSQINPTIVATVSGTGTGTLSPLGTTIVTKGNNQQYNISADAGSVITSVTVDGSNQGAITQYTFTNVQVNHTIAVVFTHNTYNITSTANAGGTITPSGTNGYNTGSNQTFNTKATAGNSFNVVVDGSSVGSADTYTFSNIQAAHTITSSFATVGSSAQIATNIYNLGSIGDSTRALCRTSDGVLHVVYSKYVSNSAYSNVYYANSSDNGATWGNETALTTYSTSAWYQVAPSIACDSANNLHVSWQGKCTGYTAVTEIQYKKYTVGSGWGSVVVITTGMAYNMYNPITLVDGSDIISLVYLGKQLTGTGLYCSRYSGGAWQARETVQTNMADQAYPVCAVVDTNGYLHCVWSQTTNLYYQVRTSSWQTKETAASSILNTSKYSIALDMNNVPHIVYGTGSAGNCGIMYKNKVGGSWQTAEAVDSTYDIDAQAYPSISVDSMNRVHVMWYGSTDYRVRYRRKTTVGWSDVTEVAYSTASGNPGVELLHATYPIISSERKNTPKKGAIGIFYGTSASPYTVNCFKTSDLTFGLPGYTLTPSAGSHGSISPSVPTDVDSGGNQTFNFTPAEGYLVSDVLVDGVSIGTTPSSYQFTNVTANHTISVTFAEDPYITATAGSHGTIDPSGVISNLHGANELFTFYPDTGYAVEDVLVDSVSVGHPSSYEFTNIQVDHTIHVTFVQQSFLITTTVGIGGTISDSNPSVLYGANKTITITPNSGFAVQSVLVDSVSVGAVESYQFTNVTASHTFEVTFMQSSSESKKVFSNPVTTTNAQFRGKFRSKQINKTSFVK